MTGYGGAELVDKDECEHKHVEREDDGLASHWWVCLDCGSEVRPNDEEERWETVE